MSRKITSALPLLLGNICLLFLLLAGGFFSFVSAYGLPADGPALLASCACCSILFAVLWSVPGGIWGALALLGLDALGFWRLWERLRPALAVLWEAVSGNGEFPGHMRQFADTGETLMPALLLVLLALLPREGYYRPDWATNTRNRVIETVNRGFASLWSGDGGGGTAWDLDLGISVPSHGEIDGQVDLTKAGPRRYSRQTVLEVTGGAGRTYLRGGASGVYTGSGWEALDESEYGQLPYPADLFPALTAPDGTPAETLTIRHVRGGGKTAYMPYRFLGFSGEQAYTVLDSGARRRGDEYEVAYIPGGPVAGAFTALDSGPKAWEQRYSEFVYSHYLDVPDGARTALEQLAQERMQELAEAGVFTSPPSELYQRFQKPAYLAMCVAKILESAAVYDLDVPTMEPGEDFVAHFLEEGRGYCVHFATAGALLLRMYGIPARYVEGYAPWLNESGTTNVRDSDAHAWVEIYLDGYGWFPVEMTPGRQGETPETVAPEILQTEAPPEAPEEEAGEEEPEASEDPEDSRPETPDAGEDADTPAAPGETTAALRWLWTAAAVLLVLAAPYGGYRLARLVGKKRREHPDTNRSVICAYRRYRLFLDRDGPAEPELEELGRKAKFSQHRLTEEERAAAWQCADHAAAEWKRKKLPSRKRRLRKDAEQK